MSLTETDLHEMASGAVVKDQDGDRWTKNADGLWSINGGGRDYQDRTAHYVVETEGPITHFVETPVVTSDVLAPAREQAVAQARDHLRMETLSAQDAWLSEGFDPDLFDTGVANGWFTDKFFQDLAKGDAF